MFQSHLDFPHLGIHYQLFILNLHAPPLVSQSGRSSVAGSSRWPIRIQHVMTSFFRLFQNVLLYTWSLSLYVAFPYTWHWGNTLAFHSSSCWRQGNDASTCSTTSLVLSSSFEIISPRGRSEERLRRKEKGVMSIILLKTGSVCQPPVLHKFLASLAHSFSFQAS